jgi:hypothetical protein
MAPRFWVLLTAFHYLLERMRGTSWQDAAWTWAPKLAHVHCISFDFNIKVVRIAMKAGIGLTNILPLRRKLQFPKSRKDCCVGKTFYQVESDDFGSG